MLFVVTPSIGSSAAKQLNGVHLTALTALPFDNATVCTYHIYFIMVATLIKNKIKKTRKHSAHTNMRTLVQNLLLL